MARRLEIELTSQRDDGSWTWRAAGAREPRGVVASALLSENAHVGDVLRVEAEFELDGITIQAAVPVRTRHDRANRIEIASAKPVVGGVTTSLVEKGARRGRSDRPERGDRDRRPEGGRSGDTRERQGRTGRPSGPGGPGGPGGDRDRRPERRPTAAAEDEARTARPPRDGARSGERPASRTRPQARPPRVVATTAHRDLLFSSLLTEQRPIAEQLAIGGLPAVRRALAEQEAAAKAAGQPFANGEAILTLAEQLLPAVKDAIWIDRAETAAAHLDAISLRDLRATVTSGSPKDEHGRALLASLKEALDARLTKLRTTWETSITHALDENKVLQALRLSSRPPEPSARFPAALVTRLAEAAGAALDSSTPPERWLALLEACVDSPIRRSVKPAALPESATPEFRKQVALQAGRVPSLASLLGLAMPPPPSAAPRQVRRTPPPRPAGAVAPAPAQSTPATETPAASAPATTPSAASDDAVANEPVAEPVDEV